MQGTLEGDTLRCKSYSKFDLAPVPLLKANSLQDDASVIRRHA
jgi:hypothetical protein